MMHRPALNILDKSVNITANHLNRQEHNDHRPEKPL